MNYKFCAKNMTLGEMTMRMTITMIVRMKINKKRLFLIIYKNKLLSI